MMRMRYYLSDFLKLVLSYIVVNDDFSVDVTFSTLKLKNVSLSPKFILAFVSIKDVSFSCELNVTERLLLISRLKISLEHKISPHHTNRSKSLVWRLLIYAAKIFLLWCLWLFNYYNFKIISEESIVTFNNLVIEVRMISCELDFLNLDKTKVFISKIKLLLLSNCIVSINEFRLFYDVMAYLNVESIYVNISTENLTKLFKDLYGESRSTTRNSKDKVQHNGFLPTVPNDVLDQNVLSERLQLVNKLSKFRQPFDLNSLFTFFKFYQVDILINTLVATPVPENSLNEGHHVKFVASKFYLSLRTNQNLKVIDINSRFSEFKAKLNNRSVLECSLTNDSPSPINLQVAGPFVKVFFSVSNVVLNLTADEVQDIANYSAKLLSNFHNENSETQIRIELNVNFHVLSISLRQSLEDVKGFSLKIEHVEYSRPSLSAKSICLSWSAPETINICTVKDFCFKKIPFKSQEYKLLLDRITIYIQLEYIKEILEFYKILDQILQQNISPISSTTKKTLRVKLRSTFVNVLHGVQNLARFKLKNINVYESYSDNHLCGSITSLELLKCDLSYEQVSFGGSYGPEFNLKRNKSSNLMKIYAENVTLSCRALFQDILILSKQFEAVCTETIKLFETNDKGKMFGIEIVLNKLEIWVSDFKISFETITYTLNSKPISLKLHDIQVDMLDNIVFKILHKCSLSIQIDLKEKQIIVQGSQVVLKLNSLVVASIKDAMELFSSKKCNETQAKQQKHPQLLQTTKKFILSQIPRLEFPPLQPSVANASPNTLYAEFKQTLNRWVEINESALTSKENIINIDWYTSLDIMDNFLSKSRVESDLEFPILFRRIFKTLGIGIPQKLIEESYRLSLTLNVVISFKSFDDTTEIVFEMPGISTLALLSPSSKIRYICFSVSHITTFILNDNKKVLLLSSDSKPTNSSVPDINGLPAFLLSLESVRNSIKTNEFSAKLLVQTLSVSLKQQLLNKLEVDYRTLSKVLVKPVPDNESMDSFYIHSFEVLAWRLLLSYDPDSADLNSILRDNDVFEVLKLFSYDNITISFPNISLTGLDNLQAFILEIGNSYLSNIIQTQLFNFLNGVRLSKQISHIDILDKKASTCTGSSKKSSALNIFAKHTTRVLKIGRAKATNSVELLLEVPILEHINNKVELWQIKLRRFNT